MNRGQSESRLVSLEKVANLFKNGYNAVATLGKGASGFECTSIWPYDTQRFTDVHFAPSTLTKLMLPLTKFMLGKRFYLLNADFHFKTALY